VVGTGSLVLGLVVAVGFEPGFAVTGGASVVTGAGGAVGAAVVTDATVEAGVLAGTVVAGAAVAGALVAAGAVTGAAVVAGALEGIEGNTNDGAGVSWALAISMVPASTEALRISTPKSDVRARKDLF
jgi:hypothetical protein